MHNIHKIEGAELENLALCCRPNGEACERRTSAWHDKVQDVPSAVGQILTTGFIDPSLDISEAKPH